MIDSDFPKVDKLKELEQRTFKYLSDCKQINETDDFKAFTISARTWADALRDKKKRKSTQVEFQEHFNLPLDRKGRGLRFHVGSLIKNDYSQVSYYLAICNTFKNKCKKPLRKFHFDYDRGDSKLRFHLQYAGEMSSVKCPSCRLYDQILHPWLSEPRLPFTPISLALLLNLVFVEFKSPITNHIISDSKWRELIKAHEEEILKPYYQSCSDHLNRSHTQDHLFTTDFCYGRNGK